MKQFRLRAEKLNFLYKKEETKMMKRVVAVNLIVMMMKNF